MSNPVVLGDPSKRLGSMLEATVWLDSKDSNFTDLTTLGVYQTGATLINNISTLRDRSKNSPGWQTQELSLLVYTCSQGFIDLGHMHEHIESTRFHYEAFERGGKVKAGDTITVGEGINTIKKTVKIARDIPESEWVNVARSIAYDHSIYHEILTYWVFVASSHNSSFSPEDLVSNFLGTYVAAKAIKAVDAGEYERDFDKAASSEIRALLETLDTVTADRAAFAFSQIHGRWTNSSLNSSDIEYLLRRNFSASPIDPWVVSGLEECSTSTLPDDLDLAIVSSARDYYKTTYDYPYSFEAARVTGLFDAPFTTLTSDRFPDEIATIKSNAELRYGGDYDKP